MKRWFLLSALLCATLVSGTGLAQPGVAPRRAPARSAALPAPVISILCYHDVSSVPGGRPETVTPEFLRRQIRSSKAHGWTFMSLSELLAKRDDPAALPPRVMVLTFDDGYRSLVEQVLPILIEEDVKATASIVSAWIDDPPSDLPPLLTWDQIRALERSGRVEIASHSHDLHRYVPDNPWRDTSPATTARRYLAAEARYETRDECRARLRADLERSQRVLTEQLGHPVAVLAWPFGEHHAMARALAREAGFATTLELGWREATAADLAAGCLPRLLVSPRFDFSTAEPRWIRAPEVPMRAVQVDLDDLHHPSVDVLRRNIERMVERARKAGATHVFLQACPDPRGDGRLVETWFMNHQAPVRADLFSMVAHKLAHARLRVWVRAPSMNLAWVWERHPEWRIPHHEGRVRGEPRPWYHRLSPNLPEARRAILDFYADLAVYLPIEGVLFDDDAYMAEGESLNGSARSSPAEKAAAIHALHQEIRAVVREWRPACRFGRNLYAPVVEKRGVHPGFAQDYEAVLRDYDLAVVMAYPHMEGHSHDAARWIASLTRQAERRWRPPAGREGEPAPVMIKLQAFDWSRDRWVPEGELAKLAHQAKRAGARHLGVYPLVPEGGEIPERLLEGAAPESVATRGED